MLSSLKNMFKVPVLRNKILFTLFVILLYRLGSNVTVPGIDFTAVPAVMVSTIRATWGTSKFLTRGAAVAVSDPWSRPLLNW